MAASAIPIVAVTSNLPIGFSDTTPAITPKLFLKACSSIFGGGSGGGR